VKASDNPVKRLLVQSSHYSFASVLTMVAGLVTFPILTRIFSVADYGVMNLVAATVTIGVTFGKFGVQHSIIRYDSEIRAGKSRFTLDQLHATTLIGMTCTALVVITLFLVGTQLFPPRWMADPHVRHLFAIASLLVLIQGVESALINFLRAEQETATLMKYQILKKYTGLALILTAVLVISRSLRAFYTASVLSEALAVFALTRVVFGRGRRPAPHAGDFSRPLYGELLGFGIPMMIGYELSGIVLAVGDRYVIEAKIGSTPLGLYAAAYNLCQYVQAVFIDSISQAIMPIYMRLYDQKGVQETEAFITRSLRTYVLFGAPVIAGLAAVGPELLPSLASDKFASGAVILPWVITGMVIDGTNSMLGAGLFINRKTRIIMSIVLTSAILNIVLNLLLVPRIGIVGSAIATVVSYGVTSLAMAIAGRRLLHVPLPWATFLRSAVAALVMYLPLRHLLPGHHLLTVGVRIVCGAPLYLALITLVDRDARAIVRKGIDRLRPRAQTPVT
jgi:O-antigen/teichoic acid export membrane protein